MGSSTTPPASRDAPPPRRGALSPRLLLAAKVVLGLAGLAGCVLLGAGGAWLFKHHFGSGVPVVQEAPSRRTPARPASSRPTAALPTAPAQPVQALAPLPEASAATLAQVGPTPGAAPVQVAPASAAAIVEAAAAPGATAIGRIDAPVDMTAEAVPYEQLRPTSHGTARPHHAAVADTGAKTAQADKAACLARLNAITADLSLRSEPPTPQQLVILKRGCK
jgi:hypothetical protein